LANNNTTRTFTTIAGIFGFLGVTIGAFGAHALNSMLTPDRKAIYETGVQYHLIHTLAILAVAILAGTLGESKPLRNAGWLFTAGIILFSGSLYALAITGITFLGAITPIGGLCFLAGWASLIAAARIKAPH